MAGREIYQNTFSFLAFNFPLPSWSGSHFACSPSPHHPILSSLPPPTPYAPPHCSIFTCSHCCCLACPWPCSPSYPRRIMSNILRFLLSTRLPFLPLHPSLEEKEQRQEGEGDCNKQEGICECIETAKGAYGAYRYRRG